MTGAIGVALAIIAAVGCIMIASGLVFMAVVSDREGLALGAQVFVVGLLLWASAVFGYFAVSPAVLP